MYPVSESKHRVLLISPQPFFEWRGSPIRISFNLRALVDLGYQMDILTFPVGRDIDIPGVRIIRVPNIFFVKDVAIGPSWVKAGLDVLLIFWALALALRHRYRIIHAVEEAGTIGLFVARLTGSGLIFEKHSDPASFRKGKFKNMVLDLYGRVERFTARHADAVICTGPGLTEQVRTLAGQTRVHHIFDIPSSLVESGEADVKRVRADLADDPNAMLITYVGSFAVYQGVDLLFESIPRVVHKHGHAKFIVIGASPENVAFRKKWLTEQGINNGVTFLDRIPPDELPDYLSASDVLLSPRLSGVNTPLKLLDYLKSGSAVLAANTPANRLILNEDNALLVKPQPEEFAAGICRLLEEPQLRKRLGQSGRKLIDTKFHYEGFKDRLRACYDEIIAEKAR